MPHTLFGANVVALSLDAEGTTSRQVIVPDGEFSAPDGRPARDTKGATKAWRMSAAIAAGVIASVAALGRDVCVDYEHALIRKQPKGEPAPASGWINAATLAYEQGRGLVASIEWTPPAAQEIRNRQFKYLSPVFEYAPNGDVLSLHSVALTNNPALSQLTVAALAALSANTPDDSRYASNTGANPMSDQNKLLAICAALAISTSATEEAVLTEIKALQARASAPPDPTKYVALATLTAEQDAHAKVRTELAALTAEVRTGKLDALIADATTAGAVLTAEYEASVRKIAETMGLDIAKQQLDALPRAAALAGQRQTAKGTAPNGNVATLTDSQRSAARLAGVTDEEYAAELARLSA